MKGPESKANGKRHNMKLEKLTRYFLVLMLIVNFLERLYKTY